MKKEKCLLIVLLVLIFLLSACSNDNEGSSTGESTSTGTDEVDVEMDEVSQLIFGTMMLDGTADEITAEQAGSLLPLWQLYQTMMIEDATASEELDAIINQIKSILTEGQLAAMDDLDESNMMEVMSGLGLETLQEYSDEDGESMMWASPGNGGSREMPEGTFEEGEFNPEDMPEMEGGDERGGSYLGSASGIISGGDSGVDITGNLDPGTLATAQAEGGGGRQVNIQTQMFLSALIEYLEGKAGS